MDIQELMLSILSKEIKYSDILKKQFGTAKINENIENNYLCYNFELPSESFSTALFTGIAVHIHIQEPMHSSVLLWLNRGFIEKLEIYTPSNYNNLDLASEIINKSSNIYLAKPYRLEKTKYVPLGTVVYLKGGNKKLMIFGRKQKNMANNQEYDYIACPYPEGNINMEQNFMFNHDSIAKIINKGYSDDEDKLLLDLVLNKS